MLAAWFVEASLSLRVSFRSGGHFHLVCFGLLLVLIAVSSTPATAQQTNPVDRKVTNPMTDTPNVNPLAQDQPVVRKAKPGQQIGEATDVLKVDAGTQTRARFPVRKLFGCRRRLSAHRSPRRSAGPASLS